MINIIRKVRLFGGVNKGLGLMLLAALILASCQDASQGIVNDTDSSTKSVSQTAKFKKGGASSTVPNGFTKNETKYKDSSKPAASGRDGEVTVTALAMMDSEGTVDLEVTTGAIGSGEEAPGMLTKVQVKALDLDNPDPDNPEWEVNYNKLRNGGTATYSYDNLGHDQSIYIHANVRGIIRGTAVVKLTEAVKYRPDLILASINAPSEVYPDEPVHINFDVIEGRGDLGANADCVMRIDGTEIDRAAGIWVDAGDAISCSFMTQFETVGTKNVQLSIENVTPGDYDVANNSEAFQIEVIEADQNNFYWNANVWIDKDQYQYSYDNRYGEYRREYGYRQQFNVRGDNYTRVDFPMDVDVKVTSGGHSWIDYSVTDLMPYGDNGYWQLSYSVLPNNTVMYLYDSNYSDNRTHINIQRYTRNVVYYGWNYWNGWFYYHYTDPMLPYGNDVTFSVQIKGENGNAGIEGELALNEVSYSFNNNYYNYYWNGWYYYSYWYSNSRGSYRALSGYASGVPDLN